MSGALYTAIPLLVAIMTFTSYIALGHTLDVATALTSLALFDLLRFPLFMLPMVSLQSFWTSYSST
jgi:ATP-binding cassette subfamily C (CFTR/MRP) protein 1